MLENLESVLLEDCGLSRERPVVVGVSGGPDSLCLMEVLRRAGFPVLVAHFNHRLRPESDAEAAGVEQAAKPLGLDFVSEAADVQAHAREHHLPVEEAARHLRYRFLFQQARERGAQAVAVGHTADDQVETVVMHFIRGAGLAGLKGMPYRAVLRAFDPEIPIVRPLLDVWREEILAFCAKSGLHPVFDPSNDSLHFTRNRLRNVLIPELAAYNPRFREVVWRSVQSLQLDHAMIQGMVNSAWEACVLEQDPRFVALDLAELRRLPSGLQRGLLRAATERLRPGRDTGYASLMQAARLITGSAGTRADLGGGLSVVREEPRLYVCAPGAQLPEGNWPQMPEGLSSIQPAIPGMLQLPGGWVLTSETRGVPSLAREEAERNEDPFQVWLDAETLPGPLELRARLPGDRFEPLGLGGHSQKLSDFMINEKIPARLRAGWPLLCVGNRIVWIPGYRPAEPNRLHMGSRKVLYFALRRLAL